LRSLQLLPCQFFGAAFDSKRKREAASNIRAISSTALMEKRHLSSVLRLGLFDKPLISSAQTAATTAARTYQIVSYMPGGSKM
jgi:hypothetical protein